MLTEVIEKINFKSVLAVYVFTGTSVVGVWCV